MPAHAVIIIGVLALVGALVLVPLPWIGMNYYNATITTTIGETCVVFCSYSVQSVNPSISGPATILDIWGWFGIGLGIAPPCINCQYKVTATLSDGMSASVSETKFISNLINFAFTDTLSLSLAYVPGGTYGVLVDVTLNGGSVATGSGTLVVP